ncbi:transcription initiation factor IID, TAF10 subunit [Microstroma glucosiphilum]|uniref:Transcription initiation factor IID, TAF10 subunit n=1 Tax=Pseudomicrostroma glucosiphilum TaxID=1684307 RepID=A0A316U159_9BASI|nr:transcription initiation factor IID, TAF10 subunit [Pseudomicrostroma glucosiphilum]PWN18930.1 transcription initiation factor IID, TAF10 subunit [Pseudomicrostroma glucosiphilum]
MSASPAPPQTNGISNAHGADVEMSNAAPLDPSASSSSSAPSPHPHPHPQTAGAPPPAATATAAAAAVEGTAVASASGSGSGSGRTRGASAGAGVGTAGGAARKQEPLMKREEEEAKKDRSLAELLGMLDGYRPVIPEEVTDYYLQRSGFESHDPRLNRLLSISAEKFISDIVSDAYQYSRIRSNATSGRPPAAAASGPGGGGAGGTASGGAGGGGGPGGVDRSKTVLTMDDLTAALGEYGVNAKRADSYR